MGLILLALLSGCSEKTEVPPKEAFVVPGCGDGVLDPDEACDDGEGNSDVAADACRSSCLLPACGDGVVDAGEACDDGENWGGDGCNASCQVESGALEVEPNDRWDAPNDLGLTVSGALPAGDQDCFALAVPACGAVRATQEGSCSRNVSLFLHDPEGALVAVGAPGADGCAVLDPAEQPAARWISEGKWSLCVEGSLGTEVRDYQLLLETPDPTSLGAPAIGGDIDDDQIPDSCDADQDGDGVANGDDTCPTVSNGPDTPPLQLSANGFVTDWLAIGPFTTGTTTGDCRPSLDTFVGEDRPVSARLGDTVDTFSWTAHLLSVEAFDLLPSYGSVAAPREAYALVYLYSASDRSLTLSVGADDGVFAWWNGIQVLDVSSCQGVNVDQFKAEVAVGTGWNSLLLKIRDQGGGWGLAARFLDATGAVVTDLEPSLEPDASWRPGQDDPVCE